MLDTEIIASPHRTFNYSNDISVYEYKPAVVWFYGV